MATPKRPRKSRKLKKVQKPIGGLDKSDLTFVDRFGKRKDKIPY